ncbi:hypothetical protein H0H81_005387, partial [Sphagnurus paluster]
MSVVDPEAIVAAVKERRPTAEGTENNPASVTSSGYYEFGRYCGRPGDVLLKADQVVNCGILNEIKDSDDETAPDERSIGAWNVLCEMIPGFKNRMLELSGDHSARKAICREIRAGMKKVRSDDTKSLKHGILSFMLLGTPTDQPSPALDGKTRHNRGWNHPQTARLLCPAKYDPTP